MLAGYARVSTLDQNPELQLDALRAAFERDLTGERTMAGLAAARARGRRGGRPGKLTPELRRQAEAMLRDTGNYPFISDVNGQNIPGPYNRPEHHPAVALAAVSCVASWRGVTLYRHVDPQENQRDPLKTHPGS